LTAADVCAGGSNDALFHAFINDHGAVVSYIKGLLGSKYKPTYRGLVLQDLLRALESVGVQ